MWVQGSASTTKHRLEVRVQPADATVPGTLDAKVEPLADPSARLISPGSGDNPPLLAVGGGVNRELTR